MQYIKLIPTLERASNTEDNMRFSTEEVMKYKHAADNPDPKKLTTKNKKIIKSNLYKFCIQLINYY